MENVINDIKVIEEDLENVEKKCERPGQRRGW